MEALALAAAVFMGWVIGWRCRRPRGSGVLFTATEGGEWLSWPPELEVPNPGPVSEARVWSSDEPFEHYSTRVRGVLPFHSLRFPDGREWDVVNGWRWGEG